MGYFNFSFVAGLLLLIYLSTFVLFAIIRIATGVSIQRVGYLSLRRIAYTPREGLKIELRGLGFRVHKPTFAQPAWITLIFDEFKVTVDVKALTSSSKIKADKAKAAPKAHRAPSSSSSPKPILRRRNGDASGSRAWKKLTGVKDSLKRLHEWVWWLRLVYVLARNSSFVIKDVGHVELGTVTALVDTRRKTVDRGRLFQHKKIPAGDQKPAEWMFSLRGVLLTPEGKGSLEILDMATLNIHGLLYTELAGLRDTSIALKLGRVHIPYDDLMTCNERIQELRHQVAEQTVEKDAEEVSFSDIVEEYDRPGTREANIVQTVSDSKEFISSILRGVQEIQMAVSFVGMTTAMYAKEVSDAPLYMNLSMNEFGIDLHRLDPKSPAHRMYFSAKDVAHQALLAAISISLSLDDGQKKPERILYVPMATTTIKTTLPSKTVAFSEDKDASERNANILFANFVVTSPAIDVDPKHMPHVLALLQARETHSEGSPKEQIRSHHLLSRLLPKAAIKMSVHEPVIRITLPPADPKLKDTDEYDLLICATSSISLDTESSHSSAGELHYALTSALRLLSQELYYHTATGKRHNLLLTDSLDLKIEVTATPEVCVVASGNVQTFSVRMTQPEISSGVRQVVQQLRSRDRVKKDSAQASKGPAFLRQLPPWLIQCSFQGSDFSVEVAGVDSKISEDIRGLTMQLESWTAEYRIRKPASEERPPSRRHMTKKSTGLEEPSIVITPPSGKQTATSKSTDGRRLAIHLRGLEAFVLDDMNVPEQESLLTLPRYEIAFSTSNDQEGPIFHVHSHIRALYVNYSLYRYYVVMVATGTVRKAFVLDRPPSEDASSKSREPVGSPVEKQGPGSRPESQELLTIDVKGDFLQIKARMPSDPPMMLQVFNYETGKHRWAKPFLRTRLIRLFAEAPKMPAWARILTIKTLRVDLRVIKRKRGGSIIQEQYVDIGNDFMRIAVPHQLVLHKVFDNLVNVAKATEQLHHRFQTGKDDSVLEKKPEGPKIVPRVAFRSRFALFEIEDGPFDYKLGTIYRIGLIEQKQRLAREDAFNHKKSHLEKNSARHSSRYRHHSQSNQRDGHNRSESEDDRGRGHQASSGNRRHSESPRGRRSRKMRYNPDGKCAMSKEATVSIDEAYRRLQKHNSQSWKKRIDSAYTEHYHGLREIRGIFWGSDDVPVDDGSENILALPERPGLMATLISDFAVVIDKPSFPINEYPEFLNRVGKGMPRDMKYSLLIPMNIHIEMGEARVQLRDYPLPLLHVPHMRPGQSPRLPAWSIDTDFVIAEEFRGEASTKHIQVQVVPPERFMGSKHPKGLAIDVRRTVSPVKTFSDVSIAINTSAPTKITWGTSLQPAIQEMMMVIEGFTKPQVDPSDRVGFWDKIRLICHSRVNVAWKGDGDVHLNLKGSRDPYNVIGHGAGFVMVWRKDVRWNLHQEDDSRKFMTVDAGEYVLAIPDFSHEARERASVSTSETDSISSVGSYQNSAHFKKTIMKLSGDVRWMAGLVFQRNLPDGGRSFDFVPHYDVVLKTPDKIEDSDKPTYDAFEGFRSNFIHMSVAVVAPLNRDWNTSNIEPSTFYNSVHLTPKFFTHFFDWWSLFSGVMSLPIRQGKLFPGLEKSSKKFGRHLATFKYNLLLSPLFITHLYKHKDAEEYSGDTVAATGLKLRLDSFMLDLHQRREEFANPAKGRAKQIKTSAMKINEAQLDFISADLRAISAKISGTNADYIKNANDEDLAGLQQQANAADLSKFTIPDNNFDWVDMDDFNELDWILPAESNPETEILPLAYAPRFTYFRQTDHPGNMEQQQQQNRSSPFGDEPTHLCIMSKDNDPRKVQAQLIQERLGKMEEQLHMHERNLGQQELYAIREVNEDSAHRDRYAMLREEGERLKDKKQQLQTMLDRLLFAVENNKTWVSAAEDPHNHDFEDGKWPEGIENDSPGRVRNDFNNRFIIHNIQLKWSNALRNIILRYVHQVSQRRGFIYYLTRRAVTFILDIVEEQNKHKQRHTSKAASSTTGSQTPQSVPTPETENEDTSVNDMIEDLLNSGKQFVDADDPQQTDGPRQSHSGPLGDDISDDFMPLNTYDVRLIVPQIQLQSEKNPKSVLLVTAKNMVLQVVQIMDKNRIADDVSGLVQRRFSVDMESIQFFVTSSKLLRDYHDIYLGQKYGTPAGSSWPPWVPYEVNFDFDMNPFGWSRVVSKTSASLRFDKYNTLRLKYNDEVAEGKGEKKDKMEGPGPESRVDHLWVNFPHVRAICDSTQYFTMYVIVLDLLLYNEPLEKVRSEKLEKIMLASDFSDLRGAPEMVMNLQARIRRLEELKTYFQIHKKYLDRQGWLDNQAIEQDLANCEDELFFIMKAITTSQRKTDDRVEASQTIPILKWYLSASEIVWHLMRQKDEHLVEIKFNNALYDRTDNSDGSNHNKMEIERMHGSNLLPNALYPEMLGPYLESGRKLMDARDPKMLKVSWHALEAIAGIPVLDQFEVDLFPLRVQLERDLGQKLFEYVFPGINKKSSGEGGGFSPFMVKQALPRDSDDEESETDSTAPSLGQTPSLTGKEANGQAKSPRPSSVEMRLRPTTQYPDKHGWTSSVAKAKTKPNEGGGHHFRLFHHTDPSNHSQQSLSRPSFSSSKRPSQESLKPSHRNGSSTSLSTMNGTASTTSEKHKSRFTLHRSNTNATVTKSHKGHHNHHNNSKNKDGDKSDDLSLMLSRASNYMTLAYVRIPSVVLCLSYKGRGDRNIEDVHNFVFRMPVLEYRNKTWSNLDLALRLKRDVIRALISHTGAIIGNKFVNKRPNKVQQSRLRELASNSSLLPSTASSSSTAGGYATPSSSSNIRDTSPAGGAGRGREYPRSELSRTDSFASSLSRHASGLQPRAVSASRSSASIPVSETEQQQQSEPTSSPSAAAGLGEGELTLRQTLARRFTNEAQRLKRVGTNGSGEGSGEGGDEESRRKSVLLLGKKILGKSGLNQ